MSPAEPRTVYTPRSDAKPRSELVALEAIYRRAIELYEEGQEGGPAITAPDSAKGGSSDSSAKTIIPKRP
jgi:hypothetical protein